MQDRGRCESKVGLGTSPMRCYLLHLGFSTQTSPHGHGDGGIVCRELGMLIQPLGQVCTGERSELSNQEMGSCSHSSASISIPVLTSLAATTAPRVQGNGHLTAENIAHLNGKIREMSPAL